MSERWTQHRCCTDAAQVEHEAGSGARRGSHGFISQARHAQDSRSQVRTLVTGGLGFIGSHQVALLLERGHEVAVVDNLSNCHRNVAERFASVAGTSPQLYILDVRHTAELHRVIQDFTPDTLIHFAGKKHVAESTNIPLNYYDSNVGGLISTIKAAQDTPLRRIVFSSSGSIYGETQQLPIVEDHPHSPTNPYSATKSICERILSDLVKPDPSWSIVALRYFNPAGAHPSGQLGEWCLGPPSNLLPRLIDAAYADVLDVAVHGDDFNTPDGTGVRDYVHVMDVAEAHLRAIELMKQDKPTGYQAINIGRGEGVSVKQLITAVSQASGKNLRPRIGPRRPGDVSALYGDTTLAAKVLHMTQYRSLPQICQDAWRFRTQNPDGYA